MTATRFKMKANQKREKVAVTLPRQHAIAAEVKQLRASGYDAEIGGWVTRHNGRKLSIEELAALNVDRAGEFQKNVTDMVRSRKACNTNTDGDLMRGVTLAKQYADNPRKLAKIIAAAKRKGFNPTGAEMYMEPFEKNAKDVGNPEYFVSESTGGNSHIRKICERRGLPCTGTVNLKGREVDPEKVKLKKINEAHVTKYVNHEVAQNPDLARKPKRELVEMVTDKYGSD